MDERCDNVRAIRDKQYLYVKNYMPYAPWGQHLTYLWRMEATRAWEEYHKEGGTDAITGRFFGRKPSEELYDTEKDPDNVHNLADKPEHAERMKKMRAELAARQQKFFDSGLLPESEIVHLAKQKGVTIYEYVRNPEWYDLKEYQAAADLALRRLGSDIPQLLKLLEDEDSGIRYWATSWPVPAHGDGAKAQRQPAEVPQRRIASCSLDGRLGPA